MMIWELRPARNQADRKTRYMRALLAIALSCSTALFSLAACVSGARR